MPTTRADEPTVDTTAPVEVLEGALREVFIKMMSLVDEEDAVLLYRCTRLAESSPLLLEACDQRRAAMEDGLADKLNLVWQATRPRLLDAVEKSAGSVGRGLEAHERDELERQLEVARRAMGVQAQHLAVEKEAAIKEALRQRREETERMISSSAEQLALEAEGHKQRAEAAIAKAQVKASGDVDRANARVTKVEQERKVAEGKLGAAEDTIASLSIQLAEETAGVRDAAEASRRAEGRADTLESQVCAQAVQAVPVYLFRAQLILELPFEACRAPPS